MITGRIQRMRAHVNALNDAGVRRTSFYPLAYESLVTTRGESVQLRRAKAQAHILENAALAVHPHELFVGSMTDYSPVSETVLTHEQQRAKAHEIMDAYLLKKRGAAEAARDRSTIKTFEAEFTSRKSRWALMSRVYHDASITYAQLQDMIAEMKRDYADEPDLEPYEFGRKLERGFKIDYGREVRAEIDALPWFAANHLSLNYARVMNLGFAALIGELERRESEAGAEDIPKATLLGAALMHFGYPPAMRRMYQEGGRELVALLRRALDAGSATSLDLSGVDENSEAGRADWRAILFSALPFVDIFVPSAEELIFMLDRERFHEIVQDSGGGDFCAHLDIDRDIRPLAKRCLDMGAGIVLIKCGAKGMVLKCAGADRLAKVSPRLGLNVDEWSGFEAFERSYRPERILSGTGAGDTSIAAFLTAILTGCRPARAVQLAAATGACCLTAYDALSGLKSFAELERRIDDGWPKV